MSQALTTPAPETTNSAPAQDPSEGLRALGQALLDREEAWAANPSMVWGLSTGFPSWDELTGGLHPGEVTLVAARQSAGKTVLLLQTALNVAEALDRSGEPGRVLYVTPEVGGGSLTMRLAAMHSRVSSLRIRRGQAEPFERERFRASVRRVMNLSDRLLLQAGHPVEAAALQMEAHALHRAEPLTLVIVDYLQVLTAPGRGPYEQVTAASRAVRELANRLQIPILAATQLARPQDKVNEPPPSLYEIRDSGSVEQDADNVLLLYRPIKFTGTGPLRTNQTLVTVAKQREGEPGTFKLFFQSDYTRFDDLGEITRG